MTPVMKQIRRSPRRVGASTWKIEIAVGSRRDRELRDFFLGKSRRNITALLEILMYINDKKLYVCETTGWNLLGIL